MNELKFTGGARIGKANATIPLATLKVSRNRIDLNASIIGNLTFIPGDVISIVPHVVIPFIGQGIKINHSISSYSKELIFWSFKDPNRLIGEIKQTGFLDNDIVVREHEKSEIRRKQSKGSFPIKKSFTNGAIVVWVALILFDFARYASDDTILLPFGVGLYSALGLLFSAAFLTLFSLNIRSMILKDGFALDDVKSFVYLILLVSGFQLLSFSYFLGYL